MRIPAPYILSSYEKGPIKHECFFHFISCHGDGVSKPVAYVASTVRNPETFEYFLQQLG